MSSPILSPATARSIELPSLLALVAAAAATDLGRERALALEPFDEVGALETQRSRYEEAVRLLAEEALVPSWEEPVLPLLERLATGRPSLEGRDLVRFAAVLGSSGTAARRVTRADTSFPALRSIAVNLPDETPIRARIESTLDRRGEVREDASPALASLRAAIRRHRDSLYRELSSEVQSLREHLSEETIPLRNGRLVLMLQAGSLGRVRGLVHGRSATGKSFYFEPLDAVDGNNQLQSAIEDEEAERRRILLELLEAVRVERRLLELHTEFLGELDLLQAAARFAELCGGRLAAVAPQGHLRLTGARHPLLDPSLAELRETALGNAGHRGSVVPLDLELGGEHRALVVTGPNAGGKTVALKTVGLLAAAHQCGLPVPALAGTAFPVFERLVATVGDEQDLLADRSTFSGRLLRLREAWEAAGPDSLVLLDELGSGTDPEEGAALSVALLEHIVEGGALAVVTTHLTQVAAAALELDGAGCAAMEFEPATGRPAFRLLTGPPGGSEAIALARRLGLPAQWLERAEARLDPRFRDFRRLLGEVERARGELLSARLEAESQGRDLEIIRKRLEREHAALEAERRTVAVRLRAELDTFRRETARRLSEELDRLRTEVEGGKRRTAAAAAVTRLFAEAPLLDDQPPPVAGPLMVGAQVRHRQLGWQGKLDRLDGERAEVVVRGKRVIANGEDLEALAGPAQPAAPSSSRPAAAPRKRGDLGDLGGGDSSEIPVELNLIGQRAEPALEALDRYLDAALLSTRGEVRIVHGHGSGRLREAVRTHLRRHPASAAHRPGADNEGGNGATVVTLRRD